jgi:hypothetical protein
MLKYILLFLLIPTLCFADGYIIGWPPSGGSSTLAEREFESGESQTGWVTAGSTAPDVNSTVNILRGSQSLRCTDTGTDCDYRTPAFTAATTVHAAFMVSFTDVATATANSFFQLRDESSILSTIKLTNGNLSLYHGTQSTPNYAISAATTYYIWVDYTAGTGSNGTADYYISSTGTKPGSPQYSITTGTSTAGVTRVSMVGRHTTNPNSADFDHVLISTDTIGDR